MHIHTVQLIYVWIGKLLVLCSLVAAHWTTVCPSHQHSNVYVWTCADWGLTTLRTAASLYESNIETSKMSEYNKETGIQEKREGFRNSLWPDISRHLSSGVCGPSDSALLSSPQNDEKSNWRETVNRIPDDVYVDRLFYPKSEKERDKEDEHWIVHQCLAAFLSWINQIHSDKSFLICLPWEIEKVNMSGVQKRLWNSANVSHQIHLAKNQHK